MPCYTGARRQFTKSEIFLGPTDSKKGETGKVRRIYGEDIMKNAAHASDAVENAERERKIIGLWDNKGPCELKDIIEDYLKKR